MPISPAFGWLVEQNFECLEKREGVDATVVSLNFVTPWYGNEKNVYNKPLEISFKNAKNLPLFAGRVPWAVKINSWRKIVTTKNATGNETHTVTNISALHAWDDQITGEEHIRGLLRDEFDKEAVNCKDLFSHDVQYMENGSRSYAHAVKDLSTFPVRLSRDILQATRSYSFSSVEVVDIDLLVLVPQELLIFTDDRYSRTVKVVLMENDISFVNDHYRLKYKTNDDLHFFYIFIKNVKQQTNSKVSTTISTTLTSAPQQARATMAQLLNPLALMAQMLERSVVEKVTDVDLVQIAENLGSFANEVIIRSLGVGASHNSDCVFTQILITQYESAESSIYKNDWELCRTTLQEMDALLIGVNGSVSKKEGDFLTELVAQANANGAQWFGEYLKIEAVKVQAAQLVKEWSVFNEAIESSKTQTELIKKKAQIAVAKTALAQVFRQLDQETWSLEDTKSGKLYAEWLCYVCQKLNITGFSDIAIKESVKKLIISQTLKHHDNVYLRLRPLSFMDSSSVLKELRLLPSLDAANLEKNLPQFLRKFRKLLSASINLVSLNAGWKIFYYLIRREISHEIVADAVRLFIDKHHDTRSIKGERTEPKLSISIDTVDEKIEIKNKNIRGYAVALNVGAKGQAGDKLIFQSEWLTDRAIFRREKTAKSVKEKRVSIKEEGGNLLRAHDRFGGDKHHGLNNTHLEYPSHIALESPEDKDLDAIDLAWPTQWSLPLMGYGLIYQSAATALGNAGLVLDERMRQTDDPFSLNAMKQFEDGKSKEYTYLSRVELPSPAIALDTNSTGGKRIEEAFDQQVAWLQEASSQTMAAQRQKSEKQLHANKPQIYLIKPKDENFWKSRIPSSIKLNILPHANTPPEVVEYWLNADIVRKELNIEYASDPLFKDDSKEVLIAKRDRLLKMVELNNNESEIKSSTKSKGLGFTHPAIRNCAVRLTEYLTAAATTHEAIFDVENKNNWSTEFKFFNHVLMSVISSDNVADKNSNNNLNNHKIFIRSGAHIKIEIFYLIEEKWFDGDTARLHKMYQDKVSFAGYYASSPYEFWVECLPEFNEVAKVAFRSQATFLLNSIDVVESKLDANLMLSNKIVVPPTPPAPATPTTPTTPATPAIPAAWFESVELNQGFYHWTGIPATLGLFDKTGSPQSHMDAWLPNYIGTQAAKLVSGNDVTHKNYQFKTKITPSGEWEIADGAGEPVVLAQCDITQNLNAQHGFYEVTLKPRFESLYEPVELAKLKDANSLKALKSFLIADNYPRQEAEYRLQPPAPFIVGVETESYGLSSDLQGLRRVASGAILTSTEVFNDTSPLSTLGGIAERIECSVIATRYQGVSEFGINPIFHKKPTWVLNEKKDWGHLEVPHITGSASVPMDWDIEVSPFAGLTNDVGSNALVIGSQLVVRPKGADVQRYWAMAKVHIRRWLEPTLVSQSSLLPLNVGDTEATIKNAWKLPRRKIGNEWIPKDFCITIPVNVNKKAVVIQIKQGDNFVVNIRLETGMPLATRYLATWHKGEWGNTATPVWSLQVVRQVLKPLDLGVTKAETSFSYNWVSNYTFDSYTLFKSVEDINKVIDKSELTLHIIHIDSKELDQICEARVFIASDYSAPLQLTFMGSHLREQQLSAFEFGLKQDNENSDLLNVYRTRIFQIEDDKKTYRLGYEKIVRDLIVHPLRYKNFIKDNLEKDSIEKFEKIDESGQVAVEKGDFDLLFVYKIEIDAAVVSKSTRVTTLHSAWAPYMKGDKKSDYHLCFKKIVGEKVDIFFNEIGSEEEPLYEAVLYKFQAPQFFKSTESIGSFDKFTEFDGLFKQMFVESSNASNEAPSIRQLPIYQKFEFISALDKWVEPNQKTLKISNSIELLLPYREHIYKVIVDLFDEHGWHIRDIENWPKYLVKMKPNSNSGSCVAVSDKKNAEKWVALRIAGGAEWCRFHIDMLKAIVFWGNNNVLEIDVKIVQ